MNYFEMINEEKEALKELKRFTGEKSVKAAAKSLQRLVDKAGAISAARRAEFAGCLGLKTSLEEVLAVRMMMRVTGTKRPRAAAKSLQRLAAKLEAARRADRAKRSTKRST